jgi:preprotein translocase subunit SecA
MRNFAAADRMTQMMERFGMKEGEALEHSWLNRSVETAQKRVEQRDYTGRKRVLDFDDVMNMQREVVYGYRNEVMDSPNPRELITEVIGEMIPKKASAFLESMEGEEPDYDGLIHWVNTTFPLALSKEKAAFSTRTIEENSKFLVETITASYERKSELEHPEALKGLERYIILNAIDRLWQEHLYAMDGLREAVYLRAFGQKDPLVEYKNDAYAMFVDLMDTIKGEVLGNLFRSTTNLRAFEELLASLPQQLSGGGSEDDPDVLPPGTPGRGVRLPQSQQPSRQQAPQAGPPPAIQMGGSGTITFSGAIPMPKPKPKPQPPAADEPPVA